jgi:hypothetical protein
VIGVLLTVVESDRTGAAARTFVWRRRKEQCGTCVSVPGYLSGQSTAGLGNGLDSPGFESQYMFSWSGQGQLYFVLYHSSYGSSPLCLQSLAIKSIEQVEHN